MSLPPLPKPQVLSPEHTLPGPVTAPSSGRIVHFVGRLDSDDAHSLLWPSVLALADAQVRQCVLLLHPADAEHARLLLPRSVDLVVATRPGQWLRRPAQAARRLRQELLAEPLVALHLHGTAVSLLGMQVMRECRIEAPVFFHTPEHQALHAPWRDGARWLAVFGRRPWMAEQQAAYVVQPGRVDPLNSVRHLQPELLDRPVREDFFCVGRQEAATPLIVTRARAHDVEFAAAYAQIAVLLAGSQPEMTFAWVGEADEAVQAVLKAAQVKVLPCEDAGAEARHFAQAWLYLAPNGDADDAAGLIEAMACGLPCVALDSPACRDLVIDSLSGFVAQDRLELLAGIARLVDAQALRQEMGQAARSRSFQRWGRHRFQASMLLAHGLPPLFGAFRQRLQPAAA
jgi:glycosyltransferase involved in cell wall biosynthesis